jgi:GGDEF domain-containing protein
VSDDFLDPRLAERLTRAARAAQTLSETLWEALHEELADPRAQRVAELSERLGEVTATVALLARAVARAPGTPAAPVEPGRVDSEAVDPEPMAPESRVARARHGERSSSYEPPPIQSREPSVTGKPSSAAVLVDELAAVEPAREPPPAAPSESPQIEIRDVRDERGPAAWIGSIGRRLERHEQDGSPFAVLLVELVDIERLRHAEPVGDVSRLTSKVEEALARELRPADSLTRESPGRYWLLAPQTDRTGASMLAERLARAVMSSVSHRGTPLEVAVGIALCPDDGRQASALAAHADVGLYAARAAGRSSIR